VRRFHLPIAFAGGARSLSPRAGKGSFAATLAILAAYFCAAPAFAQSWPERSIRLIVPFPAGGPTDIVARVLAQAMSETLGQSIIIDNRGGAGGVNGTDMVAKAAPDGYTIALTSAGALAIAPALQKVPYVWARDLKPVILAVKAPEMMVAPASLGVKTVPEFIDLAKSKGNGFNFGSTGSGSMSHLSAELFRTAAGLDMTHVPYPGAAPALNDLLPGRIQMLFLDIQVLRPHVQSGALIALGIGGATRFPQLPDVPTVAEQGMPGFEAANWYGIVAPAATPAPIIAKLNAAASKALAGGPAREALTNLGATIMGGDPETFAAYITSESDKWTKVVKASGAKLE
jgi:tripartite-type tricarboxylate transporter receptor subunit TctC